MDGITQTHLPYPFPIYYRGNSNQHLAWPSLKELLLLWAREFTYKKSMAQIPILLPLFFPLFLPSLSNPNLNSTFEFREAIGKDSPEENEFQNI